MKLTVKSDSLVVKSPQEIILARQKVREYARSLGFNLVDQTKLITATSELARNMVEYGGGGIVVIEHIDDQGQKGLRVTFEDQGPGIADLEMAMLDGFTTGNGLGHGLPGAKRLVNEFEIDSKIGLGTRVSIVRWA
ncbi:anti-sigma regulatory factor [Heliobacterium chlorum]|uniref:Anti-sigma regulatory factor n=1 Tax=Heliobacterium chlorum TaxID=2698 RepID=A0ABR7SZ66_HELCL|nr:anti-sigma regulatory factor [Heliobacterium chlorum]MBC9783829.1 anti-sigma regulatory factor [Heliobacterium chlorum]